MANSRSKVRGVVSTKTGPIVLSLMVQAELPVPVPARGPFAVLVRHLLDRLLHSDSLGLGEESASRVVALAYALALPGLLYALYLFPLYHSPLGKPPFWSQAKDHLFYTTYGFVVMGLATVLQWDLLFPDLVDTLILSSLPIANRHLLLARLLALAAFFAGILLGTSILGILFLPLICELPGMAGRQLLSHAAAVLMAGLFAASALIALQGSVVCVFGQPTARRVSPLLQACCVLLLLTSLFLFPLLAYYLQPLLQSQSVAAFWFPPFWFLGVYEVLLHGSAAPSLFFSLARTGLLATTIAVVIALLTYPIAHARRVRQTLEGFALQAKSGSTGVFSWCTQRTLRNPTSLAIAHWISQTLLRSQPVRLILAVFGGMAFATVVATVFAIQPRHALHGAGLSPSAVWVAIPMVAFWAVAGLRTALCIPVFPSASWVFRVIHGRPKQAHMRGTTAWVAGFSIIATCSAFGIVNALAVRQGNDSMLAYAAASLLAVALPILVTQILFLKERAIPFTEAKPYSVNELSHLVLTYFAVFPCYVFLVVRSAPWIAASAMHLLLAFSVLLSGQLLLRCFKRHLMRESLKQRDMDEDHTLLPGEMGLRI